MEATWLCQTLTLSLDPPSPKLTHCSWCWSDYLWQRAAPRSHLPGGKLGSAECYFMLRPHPCPSVIILFLEYKMVMACRRNWRIWGLTMPGGMKWCSLHLRICRNYRTYDILYSTSDAYRIFNFSNVKDIGLTLWYRRPFKHPFLVLFLSKSWWLMAKPYPPVPKDPKDVSSQMGCIIPPTFCGSSPSW